MKVGTVPILIHMTKVMSGLTKKDTRTTTMDTMITTGCNGRPPKVVAKENWLAIAATRIEEYSGYPEPTEDLYLKLGGKLVNGAPSSRGRETPKPVVGAVYLRPGYFKSGTRQEQLDRIRYDYLVPVLVMPDRVYCKSLDGYGGNGWISSFDMTGMAWRASVPVPLALRKEPELVVEPVDSEIPPPVEGFNRVEGLSVGDRLSARLMTLAIADVVADQGALKDGLAEIKKELSEIHQMLYDIHYELGLRDKPSHYKRESDT